MPQANRSALIRIATVLRRQAQRAADDQRHRDGTGIHDQHVLQTEGQQLRVREGPRRRDGRWLVIVLPCLGWGRRSAAVSCRDRSSRRRARPAAARDSAASASAMPNRSGTRSRKAGSGSADAAGAQIVADMEDQLVLAGRRAPRPAAAGRRSGRRCWSRTVSEQFAAPLVDAGRARSSVPAAGPTGRGIEDVGGQAATVACRSSSSGHLPPGWPRPARRHR